MRIVRDRQLKAGRDTKEFIHFILLKKKGEKSQKECVGEIGEKKKRRRGGKKRGHIYRFVCIAERETKGRTDRKHCEEQGNLHIYTSKYKRKGVLPCNFEEKAYLCCILFFILVLGLPISSIKRICCFAILVACLIWIVS